MPFLFPGVLPDSDIQPSSPESPALQADSLPLNHLGNQEGRQDVYNSDYGLKGKSKKLLLPCAKVLSHSVTSDSATPWTAVCQAPLSVEFSRQEYWSGLPFLSPGDFPNPGVNPTSPALQANSLPSETLGKLPC